jgi:hypothetical protein
MAIQGLFHHFLVNLIGAFEVFGHFEEGLNPQTEKQRADSSQLGQNNCYLVSQASESLDVFR